VSLSFFRISGRNSGNPEKHEILKNFPRKTAIKAGVQYLYMIDLLVKFLKTLERFLSPCRSQTNQKTR
jgi:hypothetical protein